MIGLIWHHALNLVSQARQNKKALEEPFIKTNQPLKRQ
jgi:hypothetical protein